MVSNVRDVMNQDLFATRAAEPAAQALEYLMLLGIHAAPVVDDAGRPVGMLSISDLVGSLDAVTVGERMNTPPIIVGRDEPLEEAANRLADTGYHHLAVVDGAGRAVGFLSAVDVIRAQLGRRILHPDLFPYGSAGPDVEWSERAWLTEEGVADVPAEPGMLVLLAEGPGGLDTVVWAETAPNLVARLRQLRDEPPERLFWYLEGGALRFRTAPIPSHVGRRKAFGTIVGRLVKD
jgi:CBS domain-containing protein